MIYLCNELEFDEEEILFIINAFGYTNHRDIYT